MSLYFNNILIFDKEEIVAETENKVANILDNFIFQDLFVHILEITGIQFFYIDEIQEVFILESTKCPTCAPDIREGGEKIIWERTAMMVFIFLDSLNDPFLCKMRHRCQQNIEETLISFFYPLNNANMLSKRDSQKLCKMNSYRIQQVCLPNLDCFNICILQEADPKGQLLCL